MALHPARGKTNRKLSQRHFAIFETERASEGGGGGGDPPLLKCSWTGGVVEKLGGRARPLQRPSPSARALHVIYNFCLKPVAQSHFIEFNTVTIATHSVPLIAPQSCDVSLDVAILVESSANVPSNDFQNMKDFIKDTVKYLLAFEGEQQVSIILYGSQATTRVAFGQYHSEFDFRKIIDSLPLQKGLARLDKALQFVSSQVFTAKGGDYMIALV